MYSIKKDVKIYTITRRLQTWIFWKGSRWPKVWKEKLWTNENT